MHERREDTRLLYLVDVNNFAHRNRQHLGDARIANTERYHIQNNSEPEPVRLLLNTKSKQSQIVRMRSCKAATATATATESKTEKEFH